MQTAHVSLSYNFKSPKAREPHVREAIAAGEEKNIDAGSEERCRSFVLWLFFEPPAARRRRRRHSDGTIYIMMRCTYTHYYM
jgi:hypothetical protein